MIDKDSNATTLFQTWDAKAPEFLNLLQQELESSSMEKDDVWSVIHPSQNLSSLAPKTYFIEDSGIYWAFNSMEYKSLIQNKERFARRFFKLNR